MKTIRRPQTDRILDPVHIPNERVIYDVLLEKSQQIMSGRGTEDRSCNTPTDRDPNRTE